MASREKKITSGRKQASASPVPKEEPPSETLTKSAQPSEEPQNVEEEAGPALQQEKQPIKKPAIRKKDPKKVVKRTFKIKLKPKTKINPKITKSLLNKKGVKKTLLKNGRSKVIRKKSQSKQNDSEDLPPELKPPNIPSEDKKKKPPVLKPIYPLETGKKKPPLKKTDPGYCTITATIESIIRESVRPKKAPVNKVMKKQSTIDSIAESIEGVVEFGYLLEEEMKSEEQKAEAEQKKKANAEKQKKKIDLLKKKIKKENIENNLTKLEPSNRNLIDMLDLNVENVKSKTVVNRRHSIEKFQITNSENKSENAFASVPRSLSPKVKRPIKTRQSLDSKRSSPYTTRSDSPARILRNGKERKLKQKLLDGIDSEYKKRRRLCSDYSGSEISVSKLSGYESDSSFSDLASLHGSENTENIDTPPKGLAIKRELLETLENNPPDTEMDCSAIKRSLSVDAGNTENRTTIDTNSNLCSDDTKLVEDIKVETFTDETINPSFKVPDKLIILGIMKQNFNDVVNEDQDQQDKEKRKTRSSVKKKGDDEATVSTAQFYGVQAIDAVMQELEEVIEEKGEEIIDDPVEEVIKTSEVDVEMENAVVEDILQSVENVEIGANLEVSATTETPTNEEETPIEHEEKIVDIESVVPENGEIVEKENISLSKIETPENLEEKNQILQALGLQSLQAAEEAKLRKLVPKSNNYTGTLKTVIKLNRCEKKKGRNSLKMTLQKKGKSSKDEDLVRVDEDEYKIMKDGGSGSWKAHHGGQSSDTAGAQRKSHYSNRSNMDGSSEHTSDGDTNTNEEQKNLVIPEKASSFSIHPGRLCKDECSYCFGKFGLFDTPCHIAQMKSVDRQNKILGAEKHLTRDSCLCDACYRHVDRKSNTPSYSTNKSSKRNNLVAPGPRQNHCHVLGCGKIATNILRRKWLIKMRKSVCEIINIDLDNPGLHSIPICQEHYSAIDHLMDCSMCKRRLARNHIHYLGAESNDLNTALNNMGIPVKLNDRPVVCKLCRYFASLILKNSEEWSENTSDFYTEYRKRLLHFHDIELMEEGQAEEPIPAPMKDKDQKKKKKINKNQNNLEPPVLEPQVELNSKDSNSRVPSTDSRPESPDFMIEYNKLIPNIAMECGTDAELSTRENKKSNLSIKRVNKSDSVKDDKSKKLKNKSDIAVQRLGSNPSISVRQLFPGEEELPLNANIEFNNVKERTPEGWEKCISTIQYDPEIKMLWNELQKPYGNQSSFLRHLILLEKYFRNGDLLLSATATHHSVNYTESVQNRLKAYDNISSNVGPVQPLSMIPFNKPVKTNPPPPPPPLTPPLIPVPPPLPQPKINIPTILPSSFLVPNPAALVNPTTSTASSAIPHRPKLPPDLISLQPGTKIPITPLVKVPQSQKIKFPITKNWRPNLIPIDPSKKPEKKPGLVQVISGGKPYHITLEDYKKMCAIKRTFDLRQKRIQESTQRNAFCNTLLKNIPSRKNLMITTKTLSTVCSPTKTDSNSDAEPENSLEKLDRTVEKLEAKLQDKSLMILPKIPKSLTVIPQTVPTKKSSRPSSPTLQKVIKPTGKS